MESVLRACCTPDAVKGISDGHLWLNRALASKGHFPAIDPIQSISRVRGDVCEPAQVKMARRVLGLLAVYEGIAFGIRQILELLEERPLASAHVLVAQQREHAVEQRDCPTPLKQLFGRHVI